MRGERLSAADRKERTEEEKGVKGKLVGRKGQMGNKSAREERGREESEKC